jgi:hypothetical protein
LDREPTDAEKEYFINKSHRKAVSKVEEAAGAPLDLSPSLVQRGEEAASQFIQSLDPRTNIYRTAEGIKRIATGKPFETKEFPLLPPEQAPEFYEQRRQEEKLPPAVVPIPKPGGGFWTPDATGLMEAGRGVMGLASIPGILYGGARGLIGATVGGFGAQKAAEHWIPPDLDPRAREAIETGAGLVGSVVGGGLSQIGRRPKLAAPPETTEVPGYRKPGDIIGAPFKRPEGYTPPIPEQPPFEPQRRITPPGEIRYQEGGTLPQLAPPERIFYQGPASEQPRGQVRLLPPAESPGSVVSRPSEQVIEPEFTGETQAARVYTPEAPKIPFYSSLQRSAQGLPDNAKAHLVLKQLRDQGNTEELEVTGVGEWLRNQGQNRVSKEDVLNKINERSVQVQEIWKGRMSPEDREELARLDQRENEIFDQLEVVRKRHSTNEPWDLLMKDPEYQTLIDESREIHARRKEIAPSEDLPQHQGQMPPGGSNFRNLLITGQHPDVSVGIPQRLREIHTRLDELRHIGALGRTPEQHEEIMRLGEEYRELAGDKYHDPEASRDPLTYYPPREHFDQPNLIANALVHDMPLPEGGKALEAGEFQSDWAQAIYHEEKGVPKSPFPKGPDWFRQTLKHLIKEAVDGGYDAITWPVGEWQRQKYGLSKHIDELRYNGETLEAYKGGDLLIRKDVEPKDLPQLIGSDIANKLIETNNVKGLDLDIGGKHLLHIYNKMAPDVANKYLKKFGIKTQVRNDIGPPERFGDSSVEGLTQSIMGDEGKIIPRHYLPITPELVRAVESQGQSTFATQMQYEAPPPNGIDNEHRNIICESPCRVDLNKSKKKGDVDPEFSNPTGYFNSLWHKAKGDFQLMDRFLRGNPLSLPIVEKMQQAFFGNIGWKSQVYSELSRAATSEKINWNRLTTEGRENRQQLFDYLNGAKENIKPEIMRVGVEWRIILDDIHRQLQAAGVTKGQRPVGYLKDYISHIYKDNSMPELNKAIRDTMDSALKRDFSGMKERLFGTEAIGYKKKAEGPGIYEDQGATNVAESPFVKKRTGRQQELIQDPFKVLRIYTDSIGKMLHFRNAIAEANEIIKTLPQEDPVTLDAAKWFVEHAAGIDKQSQAGKFIKDLDNHLYHIGARSVLTFHPMLQWFHFMRFFLQGVPEMGLDGASKGLGAVMKDWKGSFNRAKSAGLLQAFEKTQLFKTPGEKFDLLNSGGDIGNTLTKMLVHEGIRAKMVEQGIGNPESPNFDPFWEQKAVHETARIEGITSRVSHSIFGERMPRILWMFQYWKQQYGENFGKAMLDAAVRDKFQNKESLQKAGLYLLTAGTAIGLTSATGIPFMHLKIGTAKKGHIPKTPLGFGSPQLDALDKIGTALAKGDISSAVMETARLYTPGGSRIIKKTKPEARLAPRPHRPITRPSEYQLTPPW